MLASIGSALARSPNSSTGRTGRFVGVEGEHTLYLIWVGRIVAIAAGCKPAGLAYVGSSPTRPTRFRWGSSIKPLPARKLRMAAKHF